MTAVTVQEQWRPIVGCEGRYEVSDQGRVRSQPRSRTKGGVLLAARKPNGYLFVSIRRNGRLVNATVHRLVAEAFLGQQRQGLQVRHLDGDKTHNAAANLAYGNQSDNERDKLRQGRNPNAAKTHCPEGHSYTGDNLIVRRWSRLCRTCHDAASAQRLSRQTPCPDCGSSISVRNLPRHRLRSCTARGDQ